MVSCDPRSSSSKEERASQDLQPDLPRHPTPAKRLPFEGAFFVRSRILRRLRSPLFSLQTEQREFLMMHTELLETDRFKSHARERCEPLSLFSHLHYIS